MVAQLVVQELHELDVLVQIHQKLCSLLILQLHRFPNHLLTVLKVDVLVEAEQQELELSTLLGALEPAEEQDL